MYQKVDNLIKSYGAKVKLIDRTILIIVRVRCDPIFNKEILFPIVHGYNHGEKGTIYSLSLSFISFEIGR